MDGPDQKRRFREVQKILGVNAVKYFSCWLCHHRSSIFSLLRYIETSSLSGVPCTFGSREVMWWTPVAHMGWGR